MKENTVYDNYSISKNWCEDFGLLDEYMRYYYTSELKKVTCNIGNKKIKVLEIGFGNGGFLTYAKEQNWDICGLEINDQLIKNAKEKGFNVYNSIDFFKKDEFDLIVAFDVLEHISSINIINFINTLKSRLKKDGYFLARFPNGDSPIGMRNQNGDITHVNAIGTEKIIQISRICNLKIYYLGGERQMLITKKLSETIVNILRAILGKLIGYCMKKIYRISFFSYSNLVVILKK
ncbi:class I SAM-dependent methyltransferase [Acinetobacter thermotolerans]|uniref:class I SAM-dependent methyltransferase n=1 Tax=Acinetobacter thermotolerans TaxID=3151487 RepID=UPI00325C3149